MEYDGFDRHGRAQLRIGFRDNRDTQDLVGRVEGLAVRLQKEVRPYGFKVRIITRFGISDTLQVVG